MCGGWSFWKLTYSESDSFLKEYLLCFSVASYQKRRRTLVPITPMPHYSDMDTPELKNKLTRSVLFIPTLAGRRVWRSLSAYASRCYSGCVVFSSNIEQASFFSTQVWCSAFTKAPDDPQTEGDPPVHPPAGQLWFWGWSPPCEPLSPDKAPFSFQWQQATFLHSASKG